ncbi:MAG: hypothetical protein N2999_03385 [Proteobacteria bacterium]|nr:hypothetical protein [Pseudomonadota bacterium]
MIKKVFINSVKERKEVFILIFINLILYFNTLFFDFVWDDIRQIVFNDRLISSVKDLSFLISRVGENVSYYRPVFFLSLAIDALIFNGSAFGFHLGNLLLQVLVAYFLYKVVLSLKFDKRTALFTAVIFSVHPTHSEAVSWISARNELLYSLFGFISLYFYIKKSYWGYLFYGFSLLSKETAVVLPLLYIFCDLFINVKNLNDIKNSKLIYFFPYIVISFFYILIRKILLPEPFGENVPVIIRFLTIIHNVAFYLKKFFIPFNLKIFYSGLIKNYFDIEILSSLIILIIFSVISFLIVRVERRLVFFVLWFLILILPVSGVVITSTITFGSDRYLYLPSFGLSFILSYLINRLSLRRATFILLIVSLVSGIYTVKRNYSYENQEKFISEALKDAPDDPLVWNEIGVYYYFIGDLDRAENVFRKVISISPQSYGGYYDLGRVLYDKNFLIEAKENFLASLRYKPNFGPSYYFLGEIALKEKDITSAEWFFNQALNFDKNNGDIYNRLGEIEFIKGNYMSALSFFERAYSMTGDEKYLKNIKDVKGIIKSSPRYK